MSSQQPSLIRLDLTPHFDDQGASELFIRLHIASPSIEAHQPAFSFGVFIGNVPGPNLSEADLFAEDQEGQLRVQFKDIPSTGPEQFQHWCFSRTIVGDLALSYTIRARVVDKHTPLGARWDLRRDQGGLLGAGYWLLPRYLSDSEHTNVLQWHPQPDAPTTTRYVWSFGEGPGPHSRIGPAETLYTTVYMVGPIQSYPENPDDAQPSTSYWFGSLYPNLDFMVKYSAKLYPKMAAHFEDLDQTYRVFFRKSIIGFGGTGFLGSYVIEYCDASKNESEWSLVRLSTHEMVHSFALMASEENEEYDNAWYTEGIAEYYAAILPYRFNLMPYTYTLQTMNSHIQAYFTSPRINIPITEAAKEFFNDWYAEWISYKRGNAYLLFIDSLLRQATERYGIEQNGPLDDIVIALAKKGDKVRSEDWLSHLESFNLDFPFKNHLEEMLNGSTLEFSADVFLGSPTHSFTRHDERILEFGFDRNSLRTWILTGVVQDSVPFKAGLRDGMEILSASSSADCLEDPGRKYRLLVRMEDEQERVIEYLPRRDEKTLCWRIVEGKGEEEKLCEWQVLKYEKSDQHIGKLEFLSAYQ